MTTAASSKRVIFAGGIFRDLVAYSERFPKEGETIFGTAFKTGFGGKTANQVICQLA
jgi:ribokinase